MTVSALSGQCICRDLRHQLFSALPDVSSLLYPPCSRHKLALSALQKRKNLLSSAAILPGVIFSWQAREQGRPAIQAASSSCCRRGAYVRELLRQRTARVTTT